MQHVELMGQNPAELRIHLGAVDMEIRVERVVVRADRRDRVGRADEDIVGLHDRPEALVHPVHHLPRAGHVVQRQGAGGLRGGQRVIGHQVGMFFGVPDGLPPEMHAAVPDHRRLVAFRPPAELDFLDLAAQGFEDVEGAHGIGAHFGVDRHISEIHRPGDAELAHGFRIVGNDHLIA